jgi:hypothetical protein
MVVLKSPPESVCAGGKKKPN